MKAKIVLFEDEENVRSLILEILAEEDYNAINVNSDENFIEKIIEFKPDLIISDIMMPGKSGIDVFNEIKNNEETQSIPFIFLTAKSDYTDIRLGMSIGADDYILKPFKAKDLLRSIELRLAKTIKIKEKMRNFSSNVALHLPHELRTPLIALLGYSDLILEDYNDLSDMEIVDCIKSIKKSGQRLHRVIEKFILYSDILLTDLNNGYVKRFVSGNCSALDALINDYSVNTAVSFNRCDDLAVNLTPYKGNLTEEAVSILMSQLMENACRYSNSGTSIELSGEFNNSKYKVSITDHGQGMTKAQVADLIPMQQFSRGMYNLSGNGLGLAMVQKILSFVNSGIKITSEPGQGTTVSFEL